MLDLLPNVLLTISACALLIFTVARVRRRLAPDYIGFRNRFLLLSFIIISFKTGYVILFLLVRPEQVFSPDSYRYFAEIHDIATAPWDWNPILGTGPDYQATPKLGMSYLYGLILFIHGAPASLYGVLSLNVVVSYLTCVVIFLLTLRISNAAMPALIAMFLTAVYPETLFWNARVLRETLALLLVAALVYSTVQLFESRQPRYIAQSLAVTGLLLITRAQLALILPLIVVYYAVALSISAGHMKRLKSVPGLVIMGVLTFAGYGLIVQQILATSGRRLFRLAETGPPLLDRLAANISAVLALSARNEYGSLGMLLAPFTLIVFLLLIAALLRFRRIFAGRCVHAGLMFFLIAIFVVGLAMMGLRNIRHRSTVAPLELSLISVAVYYYWRVLKLPRIVLLPMGRRRSVVKEKWSEPWPRHGQPL